MRKRIIRRSHGFLIQKRRKINNERYGKRKEKAGLPLVLPSFVLLPASFPSLGLLSLPVLLYLLHFRLLCLRLLRPVFLHLLRFRLLRLLCLLCLLYLLCLLRLLCLLHLLRLLCLLRPILLRPLRFRLFRPPRLLCLYLLHLCLFRLLYLFCLLCLLYLLHLLYLLCLLRLLFLCLLCLNCPRIYQLQDDVGYSSGTKVRKEHLYQKRWLFSLYSYI